MAPSMSWLGDNWPSEDGWPYPDGDGAADAFDPAADLDDDLVSLHALPGRVFAQLDPLERQVLTARFGLGGAPPQSMKEIQHALGRSRADLRVALGDGLAKLRAQLG